VVERGGVLSHGAITARDFGIPAVACPDTTQIIKTGAKIRVDGDRGQITIIED
jgi:pyruvate,water dikinase